MHNHTARDQFLNKNMASLLFKALYHIRGKKWNPEHCKWTLDDDDEFHLFKAVNEWPASQNDHNNKFYPRHYCYAQRYNVFNAPGSFNDKAVCINVNSGPENPACHFLVKFDWNCPELQFWYSLNYSKDLQNTLL